MKITKDEARVLAIAFRASKDGLIRNYGSCGNSNTLEALDELLDRLEFEANFTCEHDFWHLWNDMNSSLNRITIKYIITKNTNK